MMKKYAVLGIAAVATGLATAPAQARMDWDWDWQVGNFYLGAEAGLSTDKGIKTGRFSGTTPDNDYHRTGNDRRWGGRNSLGYRQTLSETARLGLEVGYGDYGTRRLSQGFNGLSGSAAQEPTLELNYSGFDVMLVASHAFNVEHMLSLKAGAMNLKADMKHMDYDTHAAAFAVRPAVGTRTKIGMAYEYTVKDNVGLVIDYAHVFGDTVNDYQVYPVDGGVKNQPNGVPSINSLFMGFQFYF